MEPVGGAGGGAGVGGLGYLLSWGVREETSIKREERESDRQKLRKERQVER